MAMLNLQYTSKVDVYRSNLQFHFLSFCNFKKIAIQQYEKMLIKANIIDCQ